MKPYPVAEELLGPVLRVAMPSGVGSASILIGYLPARGRRRIIPAPLRIHGMGG
jgi:hypothetical protein